MDEKVKKKVEKLRPIDDIFFEKLMEDMAVCEEALRVILEDEKLKVVSIVPQKSIRNLQGRSVRLDALCILGDGSAANVEVQKADDDDHPRRVRYHASCITANVTDTGTRFKEVPNLYMVYITRFDLFGKGRTVYHVEPTIQETGDAIDNGLHEIYVNTAIKDESIISELMDCFEQTVVTNQKFPNLAKRVDFFKSDKEGERVMCGIIEEYAREVAEKSKAEMLVSHVEKIAKRLGSVEKACEMMEIKVLDYMKAKQKLEEEQD